MNAYYVSKSSDPKQTLAIPLVSVSDPPNVTIDQHKLDEFELIETVQAERKATLEEACKKLRYKSVCPVEKKHIHNWLYYSKNYKVRSQPKCCFLDVSFLTLTVDICKNRKNIKKLK